ncbi:MAG: PEGA domain-containing protein [Magnetococcus sp. YQC-9]
MTAMIRILLNLIKQLPLFVPGMRARLVSVSTGALLAAVLAWLGVMASPMPAPSSPSEESNNTPSHAMPKAETPVSQTPAPPPPQAAENPAETLLLRVETKPAGATLYLDGQKLGTTPFTVGRVKIGLHALRLEKENHSPVSYELELNEDTVVDLTLDTLPTPPPPPTALRKPAQEDKTPPGDGHSATKTREMVASLTTHVTSDAALADHPSAPLHENSAAREATAREAAAREAAAREAAAREATAREATAREATAREATAQERQAKRVLLQKQRAEKEALRDAEDHLKEDRLTRPKGNNAFESYQKLLQSETVGNEAREGIRRVIARLLELGREDLDEWRLVQPKESHALGRFRAVLEIDAHNPEAKAGLEEIVDRLVSLAQRYASDPDKARGYLQQAESILPERARMADVRAALSPSDPAKNGQTHAGK